MISTNSFEVLKRTVDHFNRRLAAIEATQNNTFDPPVDQEVTLGENIVDCSHSRWKYINAARAKRRGKRKSKSRSKSKSRRGSKRNK